MFHRVKVIGHVTCFADYLVTETTYFEETIDFFFIKDFLFLKMTCARRGKGIHPPPGTLRNNYNIYYKKIKMLIKTHNHKKTNKQSKDKKQTYIGGGRHERHNLGRESIGIFDIFYCSFKYFLII